MESLFFNFHALALILFFCLGIYLFERKQHIYAYACIMVGFFILAALSIWFESMPMEVLALGINAALICKLIWERLAKTFINLFFLMVEYTNIKRLINAKTKNKK